MLFRLAAPSTRPIPKRGRHRARRSRRSLPFRRILPLAAAAALALAAAGQPATAARPSTADITCQPIHVPVALGAEQPSTSTVYGEWCTPSGTPPATVQLLLPGGTYNHVYWDFPYDPARYSYARRAVHASYATLAIDRIATGHSSRPPSALTNTDVNAYVAHQVIQALRTPQFGRYRKVIAVGHSYGSITAMVEAAAFHDVDGLIDTGILHHLAPVGAATIALYLNEPADTDPSGRFAALDPGYLTTQPGTRAPFFYHAGNADPKVIAVDEATKDTITATELATFPDVLINATTQRIHVPTLIAVGENDVIFCGPLGSDCSTADRVQNQERPYYPPDACPESYVLPNAGHDINLHLNSERFFAEALDWANRHIGTGQNPATCSNQPRQ